LPKTSYFPVNYNVIKNDVVSPTKREVVYENVIRKNNVAVAPINWRQYNKRHPIKGQEFTRVILNYKCRQFLK